MPNNTIHLPRRTFMGLTAAGLAGMAISPAAAQYGEMTETDLPAEFPRQDAASVARVVGASHAQYDRVKEMVTARPALARAVWDWGFGDWESALGAASHTGRADIAELLIEYGARPDIFTFALLGKVDAVRSMVDAVPGIQRTPGPHGITLMQHARNRLNRKDLSGSDRKGVEDTIAYLESLGDADMGPVSGEVSEEQKKIYMGEYTFGEGKDNTFTVELHRRGWLMLRKGEQSGRRLHLVEPHAFAPAGAPEVRVRFEVKDGRATSVTVHDPMPLVKAVR